MFIPDKNNNGAPKYLVILLYSWATFGLVKYLQTDLINTHVGASGLTYGWGRVILISLIGCAITFAALFVMLVVLMAIFPSWQI